MADSSPAPVPSGSDDAAPRGRARVLAHAARLGIDVEVVERPDASSLEEAAAARRQIAQQCHPDRLGEEADADDALRRMIAANAAYDRLRRALRAV